MYYSSIDLTLFVVKACNKILLLSCLLVFVGSREGAYNDYNNSHIQRKRDENRKK